MLTKEKLNTAMKCYSLFNVRVHVKKVEEGNSGFKMLVKKIAGAVDFDGLFSFQTVVFHESPKN